MKQLVLLGLMIISFPVIGAEAQGEYMPRNANNFYRSDRVTVQKVTFKNQYQMSRGQPLHAEEPEPRCARLRRSSSATRWAR